MRITIELDQYNTINTRALRTPNVYRLVLPYIVHCPLEAILPSENCRRPTRNWQESDSTGSYSVFL